jgi:tRNA threonylcarbamoyladenosine biosynthesis protein TsaB
MLVLGIDTCGGDASVALVEGEELRAEEPLPVGSRASREALPAIERLLRAASLRLEEVDAFAAVRGPGSFTGLRVGLATARGLALATGKPAAGFCALDLLAGQAPRGERRVWALIGAGRGELYAASYRFSGGGVERQGDYLLLPAGSVAAAVGDAWCLGAGALEARACIEANGAGARVLECRSRLAAEAARWLARRAAGGSFPDADSLRPLYIRPSEAERTRRWRTTSSASSA